MDKGLITRLGEAIDQYRAERRATLSEGATPQPTLTRSRVRRWLLPTPGNVLFTLLIVAGLLWAQSAGALPQSLISTNQSPSSTGTIAYQGRLADSDGTPITDTVNMEFRLYDVADGGTPLWSELWTGSNAVRVSDGLFNVMLGSLEPIPQDVVAGQDQLWLGITVGTDDEMAPRVQLGSVPFAIHAASVNLASVHKYSRDETTTIPAGGHVYVGDTQITLARPGKVFAQCDMSLQPSTDPIHWIGLRVVAKKTDTSSHDAYLTDNAYMATNPNGYTSWSSAGILDLSEAGTWIIQCDLHRSSGGADPTIHTYSISAFQVE